MARKTSTAGSRSLKSTPSICDAAVSLESVLCTAELNRRLSRPPDYQAENRALVALAQELADSPRTILQKLVEIALDLCEAGSAGVSLLSKKDCGKTFYWPAIAGAWTPHLGSGTPRDFGPCGVVLDRDAVQLFTHPERYYPYLIPVTPPIGEALLTPFYAGGKAVGTVWVIAHDDQRKFDAEDMRQIVSLGKFASAAYKVWESLDAVEQQDEALRHRTAQYETLLNEAPLGVHLVDADFRIRQVNPTALPIFGNIPDVVGRDFDEVMHIIWPKPYADQIVERFRHTLKTGEPYLVSEWTGERRDRGASEFYEWQINRIPLPEGRYGVVCYFRDISRHVLARAAIAKFEARLRLVVEGAKDHAVYTMDADGRIDYWNTGAQALFGFTENEIIGQSAAILFTPQDREGKEPERKLREANERGSAQDERWYVRKDGTRFYASGVLTLLRDARIEGGTAHGYAMIARDLTERKQAEELLRESEEKYRSLFNSIDEGFCVIEMIFDADGKPVDYRFLEVSPSFEKQTGITDAKGKRMREIAPQHEEHWFDTFGKIALTGEPARFENRAEQLHRWYDVYAFRVEQPESRKVAILFKDITERKQAEESLRISRAELQKSNDELERRVRERTAALTETNAVLQAEIRERRRIEAERIELLRRVIFAQEDERRRIAREMHDQMGQQLTAIIMGLKALVDGASHGRESTIASLQQLQELTGQLAREVHSLAWELRPPALDDLGLETALYNYAEEWAERSRVVVDFHSSGFETGRLPL
ncbi:MAG: PAS domain S-box protein, partial [Pyrinomonadaceae bacterium]